MLDAVALSSLLDERKPDHPIAKAAFGALVASDADADAADESLFVVPTISLYEVRRGLLKTRSTRRLRDLDAFMRTYAWVEDFDEPTATTAAELWADRARAGQLAGERDLLILATAVEIEGDVVTRDAGFPTTGEVSALTWHQVAAEMGVELS